MSFLSKILSDSTVRPAADKVFDMYDVDKSGKIDSRELELAIEKVIKIIPGAPQDVPTNAVAKAMSAIDANKDGGLDKEEFFVLVKKIIDKVPLDKTAHPAPGALPTH